MQTRVGESSAEGAETSVRLDIVMAPSPGPDGNRKRVSPFEPRVERMETLQSWSNSGSNHYPGGHGDSEEARGVDMIMSPKAAAPEKKLTIVALRLAILEKAATGLGTLAFAWATVVLLGGFAIVLDTPDFYFVTIILLIEGARIFSRSGELEWQHETTLSVATLRDDARRMSNRFYNGGTSILRLCCKCFLGNTNPSRRIEENGRSSAAGVDDHGILKRTWSTSKVKLVPYTGWLFISKNVSRLLFWLQLFAASTCVVMSLVRLAGQNFGPVSGNEHKKNRKLALNIFYGLALAEALLFLLEKAYWQWKIVAMKLLTEVNEEYGFDASELHTVRRFFYDAYSQCIKGSVFDGLKMDFVTYSVELVQSDGGHGQRTGTRILCVLVNSDRFSEETLRAIGTMSDVVERLIEMLNWSNHHEQEIRRAAAEIITKLVRTNRNCIRVAAIAGSMESIASLLYDSKQIEIHSRDFAKTSNLHRRQCLSEYEYSFFSLLGLRILKNLAKDHVNCAKIGSSKELLPKIIGLAEINPNTPKSEIKTVKLAVNLVRMLATSTGFTGKILRKEICEIVFSISNLRDILHYREISTNGLQILAIDTLTSLALDDAGRESIGSTGGVLRDLFSMFFMERTVCEGQYFATMTKLVSKAGEALALLSLESKHNCRRIISLKMHGRSKYDSINIIVKLMSVLEDEIQGINAARILRNLCSYTETDYAELREVTAIAAQVVKSSIEKRGAHQEAAIGLAAQIVKFMTKSDFDHVFKEWRAVTNRSLVLELLEVFRRHPRPSKEVPSIRRFSIELLIGVMQMERSAIVVMRSEVEEALKGVLETTSELESYSTFSGSMGLSRHRLPIQSLAQSAMELLRD